MDRTLLIRKALKLEYILVGWNVVEAAAAIGAGVVAGSIALIGFGLDSIIEVTTALVLIWRLRKHGAADSDEETRAEKLALRIVGITFFVLAAYVLYESVEKLWSHQIPQKSFLGILITFLSLLVMPYLGFRKRKIARQIESKALEADAMETMICAYLSAIVLMGLGLNAWIGWWWADPAAGLLMVGFIVRDGWETVEEARE